MKKTEVRPSFYALGTGGWRDFVTILHIPYTAWHLSYVVLGAASAPVLHADRLAGLTLAFFLAVGLGAHALDEAKGRPLGTQKSSAMLIAIGLSSLAGAAVIGILAIVMISVWAIPFVAFGVFITLAYNMEWFGGRFHTDVWFGLAWGAFPALTAYWANAERIDATAVLIAGACFGLSMAQRSLSKYAKTLRRNTVSIEGRIKLKNGNTENLSLENLIVAPERTLKLLSLSIPLLAVAWLIARW